MHSNSCFLDILQNDQPEAVAYIRGNDTHPYLNGTVKFYVVPPGYTLVEAELFQLPDDKESPRPFIAMHIHEFGDCTPPFDKSGMHFNPDKESHPLHAGDLTPLLNNNGYAWCAFFDQRFTISDILGRSVIIHANRDDFTSQPSGDSGEKIGCGTIRPC